MVKQEEKVGLEGGIEVGKEKRSAYRYVVVLLYLHIKEWNTKSELELFETRINNT